MDVAALQTRHLEYFGKETNRAHRQFLFRKPAWHRLKPSRRNRRSNWRGASPETRYCGGAC